MHTDILPWNSFLQYLHGDTMILHGKNKNPKYLFIFLFCCFVCQFYCLTPLLITFSSLLSENLISIAAAPAGATTAAAPLPAPCPVWVESPPPPCAADVRLGLVAACGE